MRIAVLALLAGCSFPHGEAGSAGDARGDTRRDTGSDEPGLVTRKLVIDNSAATVDFINFPLLVALDATKIDYALISDPATDLRFEDPATTLPVAFEVERWNPAGESIVWVRVPAIPPGSTTTAVLMHYGPLAGGTASSTQMFAGYELVNHFKPTLENAVGPSYAGTSVNAGQAEGMVGTAAAFTATGDQRITVTNGGMLFNGWQSFNFMFWLYVDYANADALGTTEPVVMQKGGALANGRIYRSGADIRFQLDLHFTGMNNDAYLSTVVPPRAWTLIAYNFDRTTVTMFNNGAAVGSVAFTAQQSLVNDVQVFYLGATSGVFAGRLDEFRIERRSRSADFMRANYLSMTRTFISFTDP